VQQTLANPQWTEAAWILALLRDPQLSAAVRAVQTHIASDVWQPTGAEVPVGTLASADEIVRLRQVQERLLRELTRTTTRLEAVEGVPGAEPLSLARNDRDLWDDAVSLRDGTVELRDKAGALITTLRIKGDDLERWLLDADVEKMLSNVAPAASPVSSTGGS
jgi:hypothetical protein